MKNMMVATLTTISAVTIALTMAACGKSSGGSTADAGTPGSGPTGGSVSINQCQVFNASYGCMNQVGCQSGYGWVPGNFTCVAGQTVLTTDVFGTSVGVRYVGRVTVTNQPQFSLLMKYAGQCDPYWVGFNIGTYSCDTYTSRGGYIEVDAFDSTNPNNLNIIVSAGSSAGYGSYGGYGVGTVGTIGTIGNNNLNNSFNNFNPGANGLSGFNNNQSISFSQQSRAYAFNNSIGVQIYGVDYNGQDNGLHIVIDQGHLSDSTFVGRVLYKEAQFATVVFSRY
jgi:hypothetical protein